MCATKQWITPFLKQCFVTAGVSLNVANSSLILGLAAGLLEQLKAPNSSMPIDDDEASWIASLPAFSMFAGNILVIPIMGYYGFRTANLINTTLLLIGWICVIFTTTISFLLFARTLQGLCMGMSAIYGSLLIGEYTSPKNRGAFLMTISLSISFAVLLVHTLGSYLDWQTVALIFSGVTLLNWLIILKSPESPSWLATQGRYDECRKVFRWLRGNEEEDELRKMIEASAIIREARRQANITETFFRKLKKGIVYLKTTVQKKEFYKPLIIMIHIYTISMMSGVNILIAYAAEWFRNVIGNNNNIPLLILSLDVQRLISSTLALFIVKKFKRRTLLITTVSLNIIAIAVISAYTYAKTSRFIFFDHPIIGVMLSHCMIFAIAIGSLSLSYTIAGEIFPLEYKKISNGISILFFSMAIFFVLKTFPYFLNKLAIHGICLMNAFILSYCLLVTWIMLPETKDRTLQNIEEEFRGRPLSPLELKSVESLKSLTPNSG